jgi:hypothetical protein
MSELWESKMIIGMEVDANVRIEGTSLQGYLEATRDELVEVFGEPVRTYGDKTTCEWDIEFRVMTEDGDDFDYVVATIYDWKMAPTINSRYRWHIGGRNYQAVELVEQMMANKKLAEA